MSTVSTILPQRPNAVQVGPSGAEEAEAPAPTPAEVPEGRPPEPAVVVAAPRQQLPPSHQAEPAESGKRTANPAVQAAKQRAKEAKQRRKARRADKAGQSAKGAGELCRDNDQDIGQDCAALGVGLAAPRLGARGGVLDTDDVAEPLAGSQAGPGAEPGLAVPEPEPEPEPAVAEPEPAEPEPELCEDGGDAAEVALMVPDRQQLRTIASPTDPTHRAAMHHASVVTSCTLRDELGNPVHVANTRPVHDPSADTGATAEQPAIHTQDEPEPERSGDPPMARAARTATVWVWNSAEPGEPPKWRDYEPEQIQDALGEHAPLGALSFTHFSLTDIQRERARVVALSYGSHL
eukprot:SAG25_NODE_270_length_10627_cov_13.114267_5_plen_349_part_00